MDGRGFRAVEEADREASGGGAAAVGSNRGGIPRAAWIGERDQDGEIDGGEAARWRRFVRAVLEAEETFEQAVGGRR